MRRRARRKSLDITGQRFGRLLAIRKLDQPSKTGRPLWLFQCDCGKIIEKERYGLSPDKVSSCGCLTQKERGCGRSVKDISGQRFGLLTAVKLTGKKIYTKPAWLLQCDCGGTIEMPLSYLIKGHRLHCGKENHMWGNWYPDTPSPLPKECSDLIEKYLHLTKQVYGKINRADIEDKKVDSLIRSAWIVTYRRSQGEYISEDHERRHIKKWIRMAEAVVNQQKYIEDHGGWVVRGDGRVLKAKRQGQRLLGSGKIQENRSIGGDVTNAICLNYPELEVPGTEILPKKRIKFKRM